MLEQAHKGVYFKLSELNKTIEQPIKNFRGFYCDEFSEKYLLYEVLKYIYKGKYIEFTGADIKALGINGEPDYYIRNGKTIFLFESKDVLINAEIKSSFDFGLCESAFKDKFYFHTDKDGKVQKKAVLQLINNIERLLKMEFTFDKKYKSTSVKIYPILLVHDRQLNLVGLNAIVNSWFQAELEKLKAKGLDISNIKPLTILDIDTLIVYQDLFMNKVIELDDIIDAYHKSTVLDKKKKYKDQDHLEIAFKRTVDPLSSFLTGYLNDRNVVAQPPRIFKEKGFSLFK